ncbi:phosphonate C-P lyase system protein PhnH [Nitratireductor sp. OM-1]|uniref:phosphonate C-P lyase system protein PhnH n=1 Tax=Nitratireductor sp. OM-1 TaxID=1756988 RepID=UPI000DDEB20F|nr:phosphonate C-P lyase system protein PhnH [Nitratireductor sp. OM-1]
MLTVAPPDAIELRCNSTFQALMWALSRPGDARVMPEAGLAGIAETLVDLECTVFADTPDLREAVSASGALVTGDVSRADHVFLSSLENAADQIAQLRCGSPLYPDDGATLIVAARHAGQRLRLSGPGIEEPTETSLDAPPAFWAMRAMLCAYPEGFDCFFVDDRSVIGIPRSTKVEVL